MYPYTTKLEYDQPHHLRNGLGGYDLTQYHHTEDMIPPPAMNSQYAGYPKDAAWMGGHQQSPIIPTDYPPRTNYFNTKVEIPPNNSIPTTPLHMNSFADMPMENESQPNLAPGVDFLGTLEAEKKNEYVHVKFQNGHEILFLKNVLRKTAEVKKDCPYELRRPDVLQNLLNHKKFKPSTKMDMDDLKNILTICHWLEVDNSVWKELDSWVRLRCHHDFDFTQKWLLLLLSNPGIALPIEIENEI